MLDTLIVLLERAVVGRVALAFLPPGAIGEHRPSAWARTWAASHLLGGLVIATARGWCGLAHVALDARWGAVVVALACVLRWFTLPGAMVPRHEPASERAGVATWILRAASLGALIALGLEPFEFADVAAACVFVEFGLATARRRPWSRAALVLAWLLTVGATTAANTSSVLVVAAAAAAWIAWRRRADRRAVVLAAVALAGLALREPWFAATAAVCVVTHTAAPSRKRALVALAASFLVIAAPHVHGFERANGALIAVAQSVFAAALPTLGAKAFWIAVALALVAATLGFTGGSRASAVTRAVDPPDRELAALALWLVLAPLVVIAAAALLDGAWPVARSRAFVAALGACAALFVGLVAAPDERVERGERD
ncbi:MAG: hypothetical protein K8S98_01950 [Planctomycetes bacterium]|nr:hypothetical protein [Planctomycetota bacterium]